MKTRRLASLALLAVTGLTPLAAWDYAGHRLVNLRFALADIRPGRVGELDGKIERLETAIAALEADSDGGPEAAGDR